MKLKLIIVASVGILTIVFITKYFVGSGHKSKAGENDLTFVVNPISGTKDLNQFDITYVISSDNDEKKIGALSMKFNATGNLQVMSLSESPKTYPEAIDIFQMVGTPTINSTGTTLDFAALVDQSKKDQAKKSISFKIRVKGKANGAGTLTFDRSNSEMGGFVSTSPITFAVSLTSNTDPSFTFSGVPAAPSVNFHFDPSTTTIGTSAENATAVFKIDGTPAGKGITTFETNILFDKNVAQVDSVTPNSVVVEKFDETEKTIDNNIGKVRLNYRGKTSVRDYATSVQFNILFKRNSTLTAISTTNISFDQAKANGDIQEISYQVNATNGQLSIQPRQTTSSSSSSSQQSSSSSAASSSSRQSSSSGATASSSSSSRQSSSSGGTASSSSSRQSSGSGVSLYFKLRLQGILISPIDTDPIGVKINLVKEGEKNNGSFIEGDFRPNADGIFENSLISIDPVDLNAKYYIYVKGPKHIQKKFCDIKPELNAQGFYNCSSANIILHSGRNDFDFSKVKLLAGDLPQQGNMQNGIIDSYDLSFVRSSISDNVYTKTCDINLDKKCDWQDWSLIMASLAEKYDE